MVSLRLTFSLLFLWIAGTLAVDIHGRIVWSDVCSNATSLGKSKVILDSGSEHAGSITKSGAFLISDVPVGTYILSVVTHDHNFDQLRIDIPDSSSPEPEVRPYIAEKFNYFLPPESFNVLGMLSNPMTLMMVIGGAMMLATPYIMKTLDPEALEELKEQHARVANAQGALASGDFKSGLSAIMAGGEEPRRAESTPNKAPQKSAKASKRSKR